MGFFKELTSMFGRQENSRDYRYAQMLNGTAPIFKSGGTDIYANDVVQQGLSSIVDEMKKLNPTHIRYNGFDPVPIEGNVQNILENPNPLMTTSEYIEKVMWPLLLNLNSFVYVHRNTETNALLGLYPVNPSYVTFLENKKGVIFLEMQFAGGYKATLPYENIIHIKTKYYKNDLMGGNEAGRPDNRHIVKTAEINDTLLEGLKRAMKMNCSINGVVNYKIMLDDGTVEESIRDFENRIMNSGTGILGLDEKAEYTQIKNEIKLVDEATLKFLDDKILRNWHVSTKIIKGEYTPEEYEAFYQSALETYIVAISQAHTKGLFTMQQRTGYKNKIMFYPKELIFMNTAQTIAMVNLLGQSGTLYENEKRTAFGYQPDKNLAGVRMMSLNYVDVKHAKEYQLKKNDKRCRE